MDTRTEPIRQDIDQIRDSMTGKMEQIEAKIKGTVEDTTETLKRGLDVKYQVSEHPWAALGAAVLAGYALGSMGDSSSAPSTYRYRNDYQHNDFRNGDSTRYYGENQQSGDWNATRDASDRSNTSGNTYASSNSQWSQNQQKSSGFFDQVMGELGIEMDTLKTAAISSLVNLVRDTVKQNLPGVYQEAERLRSDSQSSGNSFQSGSSYGSSSGMSSNTSGSSYTSPSGSSSYGTSTSSGSSPYSSSRSDAPSGASTGGSGEGEFYREADITEGNAPHYDRTNEIYPAGSSESDRDPSESTQRDVGRNPNYDMIPPSPHANPGGRP